MSKEITPPVEKKKCPKCSRELPIDANFCQSCQYSFSKSSTPTENEINSQWRQVKKRLQRQNTTTSKFSPELLLRKCANCNTTVESTILEQCPLCMHTLPPLPPKQKDELDRIMFTGKKLVSEKEMRIDRNQWTSWKEVFNVIFGSLLLFVFAVLVDFVLSLPSFETTLDPETVNTIRGLINFVAFATLGVYPLLYASINHLNWKKIGFKSEKILLLIIVGILCGGIFYFAEYGIEYLMDFIPLYAEESILGILFNKPTPLVDIGAVEFPLNIAFYAGFLLSEVLEEFLFRGVIHNGIHDIALKKKRSNPRLRAVLFTTLMITAFNFFFNFSGYLLAFNLGLSLLIGIAYELSNRSLTIIISMKTIYVGLSILFAFIPLF